MGRFVPRWRGLFRAIALILSAISKTEESALSRRRNEPVCYFMPGGINIAFTLHGVF